VIEIDIKKLLLIADPEVAEKVCREVPKASAYDVASAVLGTRSLIVISGSSAPTTLTDI
jgi:hypothetical protein